MPKDQAGKFHLNSQKAHASDRMATSASGKMSVQSTPKETPENTGTGEGGASSHLHDHGDGTFHVEHEDGSRTEHPHIGHALMHMAAKHAPGDKHMHAHHDGMSHTSHHVGEDGAVQGPTEHENTEALKEHLGRFFDEESKEPEHWGGEDGGEESYASGGKSLHGM